MLCFISAKTEHSLYATDVLLCDLTMISHATYSSCVIKPLLELDSYDSHYALIRILHVYNSYNLTMTIHSGIFKWILLLLFREV